MVTYCKVVHMFSNTASAPRFDRIFSLTLIILIGLAVIFLVDGNPNTLRIVLGGDLPTISLAWFLVGSLAAITSAGADLLARAHPQVQTRTFVAVKLGPLTFEIAPSFWILPSFGVVGSFAFFRLFSDRLDGTAFALALATAGSSLLIILIAQHYLLDRSPVLSQRAQVVLQLLGYLMAFGIFSAIYYTRYRTLYSASLIGGTALLIAYALLANPTRTNALPLSLLVGLIMAEVTWAINYWSTTFLIAGTLLLVVFYLAVSLLHSMSSGQLSRRLLLEYSLLGLVMFVAIVYTTLQLN